VILAAGAWPSRRPAIAQAGISFAIHGRAKHDIEEIP
jgi:hypothetical protein